MKSVRLGDLIQFDGDSWQVAAQDGATLALKSLSTGRVRKVPVADLLSDESYLQDSPDRLPDLANARVLDTLPDAERARVEWLHRHVHEVLTGTPPPTVEDEAPAGRPEYAPELLLRDRMRAKLAELDAAGQTMTERQLYRHLAAYRAEGIAGLVDKRRLRLSTPAGRANPRVVELLEEEIAGQTNISTGTRSRAITRATLAAEREGIEVPSRATLYRILAKIERDRHAFGNATTRRTQANRPNRSYGRQAPARPGELVEIDSTPLDVMALFPDGSTGRVDLTVALDIATRTPMAAILRPVAAKGVDAAILLARAMTPLLMQPGWGEHLSYARSILPLGALPEQETVAADVAARPVIVPEQVTIDRGKVFVGQTFMSATERLGISVVKAAPRTPTDKPHIERLFRSVNTGFTQYLHGYTGPNVVLRGKNVEADAALPLAALQALLDWWLVAVWQHLPHSGLTHPALPKKRLSPNEMYAALAGVAPPVNVAMDREDYIGLLPVSFRRIQHYGINFDGLVYDSADLHPYRGMLSGLPAPASDKWEIRFDPYRMTSIYVRDHYKGLWIDARWALASHVVGPFTRDLLIGAKKALATRTGRTDYPGADLLAEMNRILTAPVGRAEASASRRALTTEPTISPGAPETAAPVDDGDVARAIALPAPGNEDEMDPPVISVRSGRIDNDDAF